MYPKEYNTTSTDTKVTITSIRDDSGSIKTPICICRPLKSPRDGMLSQSTATSSGFAPESISTNISIERRAEPKAAANARIPLSILAFLVKNTIAMKAKSGNSIINNAFSAINIHLPYCNLPF